jgi:MGT family glycosyltransferase
MATALFLSVPAHGNINPTLGLVSELVKQGETIIYFASDEFKHRIEETGAIYKSYAVDLDIFKANNLTDVNPILRVIQSAPKVIADILNQIRDIKFDYLIHSAAFLFTKPIAQILKVPTVSSLAIFAGLDAFFDETKRANSKSFSASPELSEALQCTAQQVLETYQVTMPVNILDLIFNKGDINLVYTSAYFAANITYFDDSFKFVGPPIYNRNETVDFPFEKLKGKRVLYISLGTVFGNHAPDLYNVFFKSFANWDGIVVMAAYNVDQSQFDIPDNFIVRNYVPQNELLKYTTAAITHTGMNSMNDLLYNNIPFISLPIGADQPALAKRAEELGATIVLDINNLDPQELRSALEILLINPDYIDNIKKISQSFKEAGGYQKAVEEIFKLRGIINVT